MIRVDYTPANATAVRVRRRVDRAPPFVRIGTRMGSIKT